MTFKRSSYNLDLIRLSDDLFSLRLSQFYNVILEIKFDQEYMMSLYGLFYQLFSNKTSFGIDFPITSSFEIYQLIAHFDASQDFAIITIIQKNLYGYQNQYTIVSDLEDEYVQIFDTFEKYIYDYLSNDEIECFVEDIDAMSVEMSMIINERQRQLKLNKV